jgi:hypothetical protein
MPAKQNGTRKTTHSPIMSDEEKTAQYALAMECMSYEWETNPRWQGIERPFTAEDVLRLRGSVQSAFGICCRPSLTSTRWAP